MEVAGDRCEEVGAWGRPALTTGSLLSSFAGGIFLIFIKTL